MGGTSNTAGPQPDTPLEQIRVCIVSDGTYGDRAFEQCLGHFPTEFALVEPVPPTVVDDVTVEVPEADLYLS